MANKNFTVTWNPGAGGHFLRTIIEIEIFDLDYKSTSDPHGHNDGVSKVNLVHPYDKESLDSTHKIIKPYFNNTNMKYFHCYRNEILWLKSNVHFLEELKQKWNMIDPICEVSFNIDMINLYDQPHAFYKDIRNFLGIEDLKKSTKEYIDKKRNLNLPLFKRYIQNVVSTVEALRQKKTMNIRHLSNNELAMTLCEYFHMDQNGTNNFCVRYDNKPIETTTDILRYVSA